MRAHSVVCDPRYVCLSVWLQVPRDGVESADPYVKLYVLPDPDKVTKRKTKIAQRTLSPTYNETVSPPKDKSCSFQSRETKHHCGSEEMKSL